MVDRIVLAGLEFHGYHGVFPVEEAFGARFIVDVEMQLWLPDKDDIDSTVDYSKVYELVRAEVVDRRYRLIEALAHKIAKSLFDTYNALEAVTVRVHKPHAPLPGVVRDVMVEIHYPRET